MWKSFSRLQKRSTPARISVRSNTFAFSGSFLAESHSAEHTRVTLFFNEKTRSVGFRFHSDKEDRNAFVLGPDGLSKIKSRIVICRKFFSTYPWLQPVARRPLKNRKFTPQFDGKEKIWFIDTKENQP